jgi:hypothetical protein
MRGAAGTPPAHVVVSDVDATGFKEVAKEVGQMTQPESVCETMFGVDDGDIRVFAARAIGKDSYDGSAVPLFSVCITSLFTVEEAEAAMFAMMQQVSLSGEEDRELRRDGLIEINVATTLGGRVKEAGIGLAWCKLLNDRINHGDVERMEELNVVAQDYEAGVHERKIGKALVGLGGSTRAWSRALDDSNRELSRICGLLGRSGSGKSTVGNRLVGGQRGNLEFREVLDPRVPCYPNSHFRT